MKNYKLIVPIVLVALFLGSIYMLYDTKTAAQRQYTEILESARDYRTKDIRVDAESNYMKAVEMNPSIDLYVEIGEFYWQTNQTKKAMNWGASITKNYPEEAAGYEFLMEIYNTREDYIACFDLAETVTKRGIKSETIDRIVKQIEYNFYLNGEYQDVGIYSGGLCPVQVNNKWGYVDQTGEKVISPIFAYVGPFIEGLAPVTDMDGNSYFIDTSGNKKHVVLGVNNVKQLGLMERGLFSLYDGTTWSFYDTDNKKIFGGYDDVSAIGNGVAAVKSQSVWKLVDRTGAALSGKSYDSVAMDEKRVVFRNDRLFVSDGIAYQMVTSSGEVIGTAKYEDVCIFNDGTYAAVKIDGKWGFVDKDGNIKIKPQYEEARSFSNGMAAVKLNGLWGFVDTEGNMVIKPQFEQTKDFTANGCAFILADKEWSLLRLYKTNH